MTKTFEAQVDAIVRKTEKRTIALARQSTQELIDEVQTPTAKGGRMRVDVGFLRASGTASLTGMPSGPTRPNEDQESYEWDEQTVIATLAGVTLNKPFYFGWAANYARVRETYDGFLDAGVQNWSKIVDRVAAKIKARVR